MSLVRFRLALVTLLVVCGCGPPAAPRQRIVLITLDTLRYDDFASGIDGETSMPLTWARASRGARFTRFYTSTAATQPAHATMFSGLHPWEHGVTRNGLVLSERMPSAPEAFQRAGFETRAVVASFPVTRRFGFGRGFDAFIEDFQNPLSAGGDAWMKWEVPNAEFFAIGEAITEAALAQLAAARGPRQFFWFHYFDPHSPYGFTLGEDLNKQDVLREDRRAGRRIDDLLHLARRLYRADVAALDRQLDRLLARLEADATELETHVFVVSDHGESFGEGGSMGHGPRLSKEQLRVPAFILSPRVAPGPRSDLAACIDVPRTLLSLGGLDPVAAMRGRDLTRISGEPALVFAMRTSFRGRSVERRLDGRLHSVAAQLFGAVDGRGRIVRGSGDALDTSADHLDAETRRRLLERFRSFDTTLAESTARELRDTETRRALEALGYIN